MITREFEQKLRPDAVRLKINIDRRSEIILEAYNLFCDDLFKKDNYSSNINLLDDEIEIIGKKIFSSCGRIKKEAQFFKSSLVLIFCECCNFDKNVAQKLADRGYEEYENTLRECLPGNANDSEYQPLLEEAEEFQINGKRAEQIVNIAKNSLVVFFQYVTHKDISKIGSHIDKIAIPFTETCTTPQECRFFCKAVKYLIYEDHGSEQQYAEDVSSFVAQHAAKLFQAKQSPKGKGCLVLLSLIGIVPFVACAAHLLCT